MVLPGLENRSLSRNAVGEHGVHILASANSANDASYVTPSRGMASHVLEQQKGAVQDKNMRPFRHSTKSPPHRPHRERRLDAAQ